MYVQLMRGEWPFRARYSHRFLLLSALLHALAKCSARYLAHLECLSSPIPLQYAFSILQCQMLLPAAREIIFYSLKGKQFRAFPSAEAAAPAAARP